MFMRQILADAIPKFQKITRQMLCDKCSKYDVTLIPQNVDVLWREKYAAPQNQKITRQMLCDKCSKNDVTLIPQNVDVLWWEDPQNANVIWRENYACPQNADVIWRENFAIWGLLYYCSEILLVFKRFYVERFVWIWQVEIFILNNYFSKYRVFT
jgi:hypothetical protein